MPAVKEFPKGKPGSATSTKIGRYEVLSEPIIFESELQKIAARGKAVRHRVLSAAGYVPETKGSARDELLVSGIAGN